MKALLWGAVAVAGFTGLYLLMKPKQLTAPTQPSSLPPASGGGPTNVSYVTSGWWTSGKTYSDYAPVNVANGFAAINITSVPDVPVTVTPGMAIYASKQENLDWQNTFPGVSSVVPHGSFFYMNIGGEVNRFYTPTSLF